MRKMALNLDLFWFLCASALVLGQFFWAYHLGIARSGNPHVLLFLGPCVILPLAIRLPFRHGYWGYIARGITCGEAPFLSYLGSLVALDFQDMRDGENQWITWQMFPLVCAFPYAMVGALGGWAIAWWCGEPEALRDRRFAVSGTVLGLLNTAFFGLRFLRSVDFRGTASLLQWLSVYGVATFAIGLAMGVLMSVALTLKR